MVLGRAGGIGGQVDMKERNRRRSDLHFLIHHSFNSHWGLLGVGPVEGAPGYQNNGQSITRCHVTWERQWLPHLACPRGV